MLKPSHLRTPRTLQECHFTPGYKGGISCEEEEMQQGKSWILILCIFLGLIILASLSSSFF